ncbi:MAG: hypothetical protein M3Z75_31965, partial [Actinomycetota bacterium]|nr:hypothetical protein [Actinomycetota bacterium]
LHVDRAETAAQNTKLTESYSNSGLSSDGRTSLDAGNPHPARDSAQRQSRWAGHLIGLPENQAVGYPHGR